MEYGKNSKTEFVKLEVKVVCWKENTIKKEPKSWGSFGLLSGVDLIIMCLI
jgi:hypothetical protein